MPSWFDFSSAGRSSRQQESSGSGGHSSRDYGSPCHAGYESARGSSSYGSGNYGGGESLRRAVSTREAYRHRDISPPRSQREQPRHRADGRFDFPDHRSVSPLGTSRFERPYQFSRRGDGYSSLGRSATVREVREVPRMGYDGYYGNLDTTTGRSYDTGSSLTRSNAVRGRTNDRGFGVTGYAGGASDGRYEESRQQQRYGSNFSGGGFSSWENY